jgi:hypothetical protein
MNRLQGRAALVARVVVYALALVAILGLLTSPLDLLILVAAFVAAEVLAGAVARVPGIAAGLAGVPLWARLLGGLAATFIVAQIVTSQLRDPLLGSEFFPMILSMAVGLIIFRILVVGEVPPATAVPPSTRSAASTVGVVVLFAATAASLALLASPTPAAADNCSGLSDCLNGWWALMSTAVAAIAAFLWSLHHGPLREDPAADQRP